MELKFNINLAHVPECLSVVGVIKMQNKCCEDKPILITKTNGIEVYSCQCACGGWCTNGYEDIPKAIDEYIHMNKRKEQESDTYCKGGCNDCSHWDECYK